MSKIFIISNTQFNISKNLSTKEWLKNMDYYFNNSFIPYLKENKKPNDILIHLGNLTSKTKTINLEVLTFIQDTFEKISSILPAYLQQTEMVTSNQIHVVLQLRGKQTVQHDSFVHVYICRLK